MANDKFYGYKPKKEKTEPNKGIPGSGNRLDRVNPYEFRKGMDYELASSGVERLKEADLDQREKATEAVLKNLEEHGGFYSALIQFNAGMNQGGTIKESSFKEYLKNYTSKRGDGMEEVKNAFKTGKMKDADHKNDKMTEPKYDKKDYTITLKEAIKKEVTNLLKEADEDDKSLAKDDKSAAKSAKGKKSIEKQIDKLQQKKTTLNDKRKEHFEKYKNGTKKQSDVEKFKEKVKPLQDEVKAIDKELEGLHDQLLGIKNEAKMTRREIAKTMMSKDVHMEILNIIKEAGVSLQEGAEGVKMHYEIAKTAYQEGMMAGMKKD